MVCVLVWKDLSHLHPGKQNLPSIITIDLFYSWMNLLHLLFSSLENMYKELSSDIEGFQHPGHGDLTGWAKQGIPEQMAMLLVEL